MNFWCAPWSPFRLFVCIWYVKRSTRSWQNLQRGQEDIKNRTFLSCQKDFVINLIIFNERGKLQQKFNVWCVYISLTNSDTKIHLSSPQHNGRFLQPAFKPPYPDPENHYSWSSELLNILFFVDVVKLWPRLRSLPIKIIPSWFLSYFLLLCCTY